MRVVNVTFDIGLLVGVDGHVITKIFLPIVLYRSYLPILPKYISYISLLWTVLLVPFCKNYSNLYDTDTFVMQTLGPTPLLSMFTSSRTDVKSSQW